MGPKKVNWGILSTGVIAREFAEALKYTKTGKLLAVASRARASASNFAEEFKIPLAYGSYQALLDDPEVEAVYIATPHPYHAEWSIRAARAGKHVLCEKPLTMNFREAREVVMAAKANRVFLMEAFMYRCHPQTARLVELVEKKTVGEVRLIQTYFCFERPVDLMHRLFNKKLGGGGILDIGCYPVSMARRLAGAALGKPFLDPVKVAGTGVIGKKSRVDEMALASLQFPNGVLAEVGCGIRLDRGVGVTVWGSKGRIHTPSPWHPGRWSNGVSEILIYPGGQAKSRRLKLVEKRMAFTIEADVVGEAILKGKKEAAPMPWADSLGNMRTLELWLEQLKNR